MRILIQVVVFSLCFFFGCSSPGKKEQKNKIAVPIPIEIHSVDPRRVSARCFSQLSNMLYDGLMRRDEHGNLDCGLAKSFTIDACHKEYTFVLRDAFWSNGDPITAYDVEASWKGALHPQFASSNTSLLFFLKNAKAYTTGECSLDEVGVTALNDKTLHVTLENPTSYFLEMLTISIFKPVQKRIAQEKSLEIDACLASGPFRIKSFRRSVGLTLEKNPLYWDAESVQLDEIEVAYLPDLQTQAYLFKQGELDWIGQPFSSFDHIAYENIGSPEPLQKHDAFAVFWLHVNTEHSLMKNKHVRKAISYAINRGDIVDHVLDRLAHIPDGVLPNSLNTRSESILKDTGPKRAVEVFNQGLQELGMNPNNVPKIELNYVSIGTNSKIAEIIQRQLHDTLGLEVTLKSQDWKVMLDSVKRGHFDLAEFAWYASYPDPSYFFHLFENRGSEVNYSRWEHDEFLLLVKELSQAKTEKYRRELILKLNEILVEELPVIPIYDPVYSFVTSKKVKNVVFSEMGIADFKYVSISAQNS